MANLSDIIQTTLRHRSARYWHKPDTFQAALRAAEAAQDQGIEAMVNAIEREITSREFVCNFDDPCDAWAA